MEVAQSFRDSCPRGATRHRGPGLLSPCGQIRLQDPDPCSEHELSGPVSKKGWPHGTPVAGSVDGGGAAGVRLAPSELRSAGRQWEAREGLEEHVKARFPEDSALAGWGGVLWTGGRQDASRWRREVGHVGRWAQGRDPAGGEKSRVCSRGPQFWGPNNVRHRGSCFTSMSLFDPQIVLGSRCDVPIFQVRKQRLQRRRGLPGLAGGSRAGPGPRAECQAHLPRLAGVGGWGGGMVSVPSHLLEESLPCLWRGPGCWDTSALTTLKDRLFFRKPKFGRAQ